MKLNEIVIEYPSLGKLHTAIASQRLNHGENSECRAF